jgi:hypothetical protein
MTPLGIPLDFILFALTLPGVNIPLTALAIGQDGSDWGFLADAAGFGGAMIWFGSSAGVALSKLYPQAKSVGAWLRSGWHLALGHVCGDLVMLAVFGIHGHPINERAVPPALAQGAAA